MKPKTNREISSVKSEMSNFLGNYMYEFLQPSDTVLKSIGGNYKVYDEILRDDQVKSTLQQRIDAVASAPWIVEPASESAIDKQAADFVREQLEKLKFNDLTKKMLYCQFYGYSVAEIVWDIVDGKYVWKKIAVRDRSRFKFDKDCKLRLITLDNFKGIPCDEPYYWYPSVGATHDDEPYGLGLAHYLYWPVIFKRGGTKFWMKFVERFAQPSVLGKFPQGSTDEDIDNLLKAIKSIASETGTVIPDGMEIDMVEASRNGTSDYSKLIEVMDKAISKIVVGQTMTTDDGSSKSQAQVHYDVRQDLIDGDADLICESLTDGPVTWLVNLNFAGAGVPKVTRQTEPCEDINKIIERDVKKKQLGASPTQEYLDETYGPGWIIDNAKPESITDDEFVAFAESFFPDQTELDQALDSISDDETNEQMAPIIEPILKFAEKYGPDKTLKKMSELYDTMDFEDLTDQLTQMLFVADNWGRFNAVK